jgi:hypothetical protein
MSEIQIASYDRFIFVGIFFADIVRRISVTVVKTQNGIGRPHDHRHGILVRGLDGDGTLAFLESCLGSRVTRDALNLKFVIHCNWRSVIEYCH